MTWKDEIKKNDREYQESVRIHEQIKLACKDIVEMSGMVAAFDPSEGGSPRPETLKKVFELVKQAQRIANDEF